MNESGKTQISVMIVDDHPIVRSGLRSLLSNYSDMRLAGEAETAAQAIALCNKLQPDVILLDIRMPGMTGLDAIRDIIHTAPETRVLMLSSFEEDEYLNRALQAGAHGYILKSASDETLVTAVRAAYRGERVLSPTMVDRLVRQVTTAKRVQVQHTLGLSNADVNILNLIAQGASNARLAGELFVSEATVKRKLQELFEKLSVGTRAQAAAEAMRRGLLDNYTESMAK